MKNATSSEPNSMAKQQRSVQLPADIYDLTQRLESRSGVKFNRQVLAAVLKFFFDGLDNPEIHAQQGPDFAWLSVAVAVERGEIAVENLPLAILDGAIAQYERRLILCARGHPLMENTDPEQLKREMNTLRERRQGWKNNIADLGGPMGAIDYMIDSLFPSFVESPYRDDDPTEPDGKTD